MAADKSPREPGRRARRAQPGSGFVHCLASRHPSPPTRRPFPEHLAAAITDTANETLERLNARRLRVNPRVIKRKIYNWPVKRAQHRNPARPQASPRDTIVITGRGLHSSNSHLPFSFLALLMVSTPMQAAANWPGAGELAGNRPGRDAPEPYCATACMGWQLPV